VQELRTQYQDIDAAVAPYRTVIRQNNVTPGQAINQLFKWHMELAGPNKVQAFMQLARNFGIDPTTFAAGSRAQPAAGADPYDNFRPVITNLEARLKTFEERESAALQNAAQQTWVNWSTGKPHVEKVRQMMAQLINADLGLIQAGHPQVSNTITPQGTIDMEAAYQAAMYAHPEIRATLMQEEQTKRNAASAAAAVKARKAAASMRSGAPAGAIIPEGDKPRVESVADSIKRAIAEVRQQ
jgi:hypothetical protein